MLDCSSTDNPGDIHDRNEARTFHAGITALTSTHPTKSAILCKLALGTTLVFLKTIVSNDPFPLRLGPGLGLGLGRSVSLGCQVRCVLLYSTLVRTSDHCDSRSSWPLKNSRRCPSARTPRCSAATSYTHGLSLSSSLPWQC